MLDINLIEADHTDFRDEFEADMSFDYSLENLLDLPRLEKIQEDLSNATGIAMVTVDYKGNPITAETNFSDFCLERRKIKACKQNCFFSDAYGSLKAAMLNTPYIYKCPAGLIDCAVPIIFKNNHLGAVLMGQAKCCGDTSSLEQVNKMVQSEINMDDYPRLKKYFDETRIIDISQMRHTAALIKTIVDDMIEKQYTKRKQEELYSRMDSLHNKMLLLTDRLKNRSSDNGHGIFAGSFMLSAFNMINTLAVLECADGTSEAIGLYADILKYFYDSRKDFASIQTEVSFLKSAVKIMERNFGRSISLNVNVSLKGDELLIPPCTLYPFLENAVVHGILPSGEDGRINLNIYSSGSKTVCEISDNGVGFTEADKITLKAKRDKKESAHLSSLDLYTTRKHLENIYGKGEVSIDAFPNPEGQGTMVRLSISSNKMSA